MANVEVLAVAGKSSNALSTGVGERPAEGDGRAGHQARIRLRPRQALVRLAPGLRREGLAAVDRDGRDAAPGRPAGRRASAVRRSQVTLGGIRFLVLLADGVGEDRIRPRTPACGACLGEQRRRGGTRARPARGGARGRRRPRRLRNRLGAGAGGDQEDRGASPRVRGGRALRGKPERVHGPRVRGRRRRPDRARSGADTARLRDREGDRTPARSDRADARSLR